jgi:hypothetical protein
MSRFARLSAAAIGLLALAGCADAPLPSSDLVSWQEQMNAADHWQDLSEEVAERMVAFTRESDRYAGRPVHIARPERASPFDRAFRMLLEDQLVARGVPVSTKAANAVVLDYDLVPVRHDRAWHADLPKGLLTAGGSLAGLGGFGAGRSSAELLFSASVRDSDMLVFRTARIYYVPEKDLGLYGVDDGVRAGDGGGGTGQGRAGAGETFTADSFTAADARCKRANRIALLTGVSDAQAGGRDGAMRFRCIRDTYLDRRS